MRVVHRVLATPKISPRPFRLKPAKSPRRHLQHRHFDSEAAVLASAFRGAAREEGGPFPCKERRTRHVP